MEADQAQERGTIIPGSGEGGIHDIGKNIVEGFAGKLSQLGSST